MKVCDTIKWVEEYCRSRDKCKVLAYKIGSPWHFNHSRGQVPPFSDGRGIYLYSQTNETNWSVAAESNEEEVLYVGKSDGDIGGRVWRHMGLIFDPGQPDKVECNPRFKYNQWSEDPTVTEAVRNNIAQGNITVFTISFDIQENSLFPEALEKYILSMSVRYDGELPLLNKEL